MITLNDLPKPEEHDQHWMETNICNVRNIILSTMRLNERKVQIHELHPKVADALRENGFKVTRESDDSKFYTITW